jgi:hypothetical protein
MKKNLTLVLMAISLFGYGQVKTDSVKIDHYISSKFDCAIFPANTYDLTPGKKRFTPTRKEIEKAELALQGQLKSINLRRPNQSSSPVIDENLSKYLRQYFGYIDKSGNRILFINFLWKKEKEDDNRWLKERIMVNDGGSYYWNIKFNINSGKLFDLDVNGVG